MTTLIAKLRMVGGALLIVTLATFSCPAIAQQETSVNPTAQSVKEDQLLNELGTRTWQHSGYPFLHDRAAGRARLASFP